MSRILPRRKDAWVRDIQDQVYAWKVMMEASLLAMERDLERLKALYPDPKEDDS